MAARSTSCAKRFQIGIGPCEFAELFVELKAAVQVGLGEVQISQTTFVAGEIVVIRRVRVQRCWSAQQRFASLDRISKLVQAKGSVDITCLLYTSDAADERSSVDLGG